MKWLVLFGLAVGVTAMAAKPPNVLFLFADDQRADTIAAHGNPHIDTPHLDQLSREGMSFMNNYCAGSYSGAVCVASRTMLMTGKHWHNVKDRGSWSGLRLLPEVLGENGYNTRIVGKWHNGSRTVARAFQSGTALMMGGMVDQTHVPVVDLNTDGKLVNNRVPPGFSSTIFADAAIDQLKSLGTDKPFFLYVSFTTPHDTRNPPMPYRQRYYDKRPPLPPNFLAQHPFETGALRHAGRDESLAPWPRPKDMISDQLCEYYGLITHLDEQVGRILNALKKSPHADNTIVIYTADHGLGMGSHGLLGKQNLYEQSMKCPLIISGPGIGTNKKTDAFTFVHDLNATIYAMAGVKGPENADSANLTPVLAGKSNEVHDALFLAFQDSARTIRDKRWKLHLYPGVDHALLFDLEKDPHETKNLAYHPEYQSQVTRLRDLMAKWQKRAGDGMQLPAGKNAKPPVMVYDNAKRVLDRWQPKWIRDKYFDGRTRVDHGVKKKKK
jgi:arylsulfatase A-like enzyme